MAIEDEPTEETPGREIGDGGRGPSRRTPPPPAPPAAPPPGGGEPSGGDGGIRRFARPAAFVALLVALAFAGILVGRLLRGSDDGTPKALPTTSATATTHTPPPPPARPTFESWGPLHAAPAGSLARPAARAAAVFAGGTVVVLGGSAGDAVQVGAPGAKLRAVASLPSRRAGGAAFVDGGAVYLIGGEDGTAAPTDEILRLDLSTNAVTKAGTFVEPLAGAGYAQSGGSLILVGGWTGEQYATAVLRYTRPDKADVVARLPEGTRDAAVALRGNTLYVAGGRGESGLSDKVYAVDLAAGTVSVLGHLPHAVAGASLVRAGGKLYLVGGKNASGPVKTVVRIDPAAGTIEPAGTMTRALAGAAAVEAGGATYLLGGTRPTVVTRVGAG